jgi:methionine sulfoxide reductase heme-binding subunit
MKGWPIVGWATLAVLAIVGVILAVVGADEAGIRMGIRATARTSVVFFTLAFAASALRRRWPNAFTGWLMQNRRQLGVSFASSHFVHLLLIFAMVGWTWNGFVTKTPAITRFAAAWFGPWRWQQLHTTGAYYNWFIFAQSFFRLAFKSAVYWPFAALLVGSMALRWMTPRPALADARLRRTAA